MSNRSRRSFTAYFEEEQVLAARRRHFAAAERAAVASLVGAVSPLAMEALLRHAGLDPMRCLEALNPAEADAVVKLAYAGLLRNLWFEETVFED